MIENRKMSFLDSYKFRMSQYLLKKQSDRGYSFADSRGASQYSAMLFPDNPHDNRYLNSYIMNKGDVYYKRAYTHYSVNMAGTTVQKVVDFDEVSNNFGGRKEFFKPGAMILDIGCGSGKAVRQFRRKYRRRGIRFAGLDTTFRSRQPGGKENGCLFLAVDLKSGLPFKNKTFTGIMGCESFPKHFERSLDDKSFDGVVNEVTRISKPGAIWRATLATSYFNLQHEDLPGEERDRTVKSLLENGWEVYLRSGVMMARLKNKNASENSQV